MITKLSIIVPIYNAEQFINRCILSLLDQTLYNIEIIAVDDKGTDASMAKIEEIKANHPRGEIIKIITMPINSGAAAARNMGLQHAQGKYIGFADSDDWCEPTMYSELYNSAETNNSDWTYSNLIKDFDNGKEKKHRQAYVQNGIFTKEKKNIVLTQHTAFFCSAIYLRSFLQANNIVFPLSKFSEDSVFLWLTVIYAERISFVDKYFYHYQIHKQSVSNVYDPGKHKQKIEVFNFLLSTLKQKGKYSEYKEELDFLYLKKGFLIPLIIFANTQTKPQTSEIMKMYKDFCNIVPDYRKNKYYKKQIQTKTLMYMFVKHPQIACFLSRLFLKNIGL